MEGAKVKPPKKVKAVKAWAIVFDKINLCQIHPTRREAQRRAFVQERVIPVLITPLSERGK